jgi:hypothetical protein
VIAVRWLSGPGSSIESVDADLLIEWVGISVVLSDGRWPVVADHGNQFTGRS